MLCTLPTAQQSVPEATTIPFYMYEWDGCLTICMWKKNEWNNIYYMLNEIKIWIVVAGINSSRSTTHESRLSSVKYNIANIYTKHKNVRIKTTCIYFIDKNIQWHNIFHPDFLNREESRKTRGIYLYLYIDLYLYICFYIHIYMLPFQTENMFVWDGTHMPRRFFLICLPFAHCAKQKFVVCPRV